jgi:hypothetical protein
MPILLLFFLCEPVTADFIDKLPQIAMPFFWLFFSKKKTYLSLFNFSAGHMTSFAGSGEN